MFEAFTLFEVVTLLGTIAAIGIAIFSHMKSKKSAKPSYQMYSLKLLGRDENSLPKEVKVYFKQKAVERLTKTTLILWNNGTELLDNNEMVNDDPLKISFSEGDNILSYEIVKKTNDFNKFELSKIENHPHILQFSFSYLNPKDGATVELLHDSENPYPKLTGTIKGIPKGFKDLSIVKSLQNAKLFRKITLFSFLALSVGVALIAYGFNPQFIASSEKEEFLSAVMAGIGVIYVLMSVALFFLRIKSRPKYPKLLTIDESDS